MIEADFYPRLPQIERKLPGRRRREYISRRILPDRFHTHRVGVGRSLATVAKLISLGRYNHPSLLELAKSDLFATLAVARPSLGVFPPGEWKKMCGESDVRVENPV